MQSAFFLMIILNPIEVTMAHKINVLMVGRELISDYILTKRFII